MAPFNTAQKCILAGVISLLLAYGSGNFVVFTGFCCSLLLGWFSSVSLLRLNSHLASEWVLDVVTLFKANYSTILKKLYGQKYEQEIETAKLHTEPKNETPVQEIKLFIDLILQDFVSTWYDYISEEQQTFEEIQEILEDLSVSCLRKIKSLDARSTAESVIRLFQKHLAEYQDVKKQWQLQPNFRKKGNKNGPEFKKKRNIVQMYKNLEKFHACLRSDMSEYRYALVMVDTLLKVLLDEKLHKSYIVKELVTEILAVNVIQNVVNLLSDPHFLHKAIILITSDEKLILVDGVPAKTETTTGAEKSSASGDGIVDHIEIGPVREEPEGQTSVENDLQVNLIERLSSIVDGSDKDGASRADIKSYSSTEPSFLWELAENPAYTASRSNSAEPATCASSTPAIISKDTDLSEACFLGISPIESVLPKRNSAPDLTDQNTKCLPLHIPVRTPRTQTTTGFARSPSLPLLLNKVMEPHIQTDIPAITTTEPTGITSADTSDIITDEVRYSPRFFIGSDDHSDIENSSLDSEISNQLNASPRFHGMQLPRPRTDGQKDEVDVGEVAEAVGNLEASTHVPPRLLFAEISIPETESTRESYNNNTYTLYVIQYMAWHLSQDNKSWILKQDVVKRRYREFITLQDRLEGHQLYKKTIRKIKGPSRWNTLHVGQMQDHRIENRRQFLQTYLKQLIEKEDVGNSMAIKEFLAYEGDASIAFVKKAREIPRLDKVIVKTVSGVFNRISSALPVVPDDDKSSITSSDCTSPQGPNSPGEEWTDPDQLIFSFDFSCSAELGEQREKSEMEDVMNSSIHITEKEGGGDSSSSSTSHDFSKDDDFRDALEVSFLYLPRSEGDGSEEISPPVVEAGDSSIPLSAAVLDLAAQSADGIESWVRKDKIFYLIKVLFGRALERFLKEEIAELTTEKMAAFYLEKLRETLWPGGQWDTQPLAPPSEEQKIVTKHQAHQCLAQFLPNFIPAIVSYEDYDKCIGEIMECLQYPELNRHFVFSLLDHILDIIFPEFESGQLHEELLTAKHAGDELCS